MKKIIKPLPDEIKQKTWQEYFEGLPYVGRRWPSRPKACGNCAVNNGFYKEHSDGLKECSEDLKIKTCLSWECHWETKQYSCKGNWDNVYKKGIK